MAAPAAAKSRQPLVDGVGVYRPRRPRASPLYRLIERHFRELGLVWDERFAASATSLGLWIDHREATIVTLTSATVTGAALIGATQAVHQLESGMEKHVRFSSGDEQSAREDTRDRRFTNHLNLFFQQVIEQIRAADAIFILGPWEAKGELVKRLESQNLGGRVVRVESADKLTEAQIAAKVRAHFASNAI